MIIRFNSSGKVILCSGDTAAIYKLSDISLEYDATFDKIKQQQESCMLEQLQSHTPK